MLSVTKKFEFHSAHFLPEHQGACNHLHGHSYFLEISVYAENEKTMNEGPEKGMIIDFSLLKQIVQERVINYLDHASINDIMENPTAENMVEWIRLQLLDMFPTLYRIRLYETSNSFVEWERFR